MVFTSDTDGVDKRRREDVEDLQNEIAGRETGRRAHFLPNGPRSEEAKRKKREERAFQTRLAELLADPIYRAKYETAIRVLNSAEQATDAALAQIDIDLAAARDGLTDIQDRAARLPDGTRVYRDDDGNIRREDGSLVDAVLVDTILWTGDEPSFEAYRDAVGIIEKLERAQKEVEGYRDGVLGPSRDRIMDEDNPEPPLVCRRPRSKELGHGKDEERNTLSGGTARASGADGLGSREGIREQIGGDIVDLSEGWM